jgi:hypothetical protein
VGKIHGLVVSKETGKPISNLQVAFFDSNAAPGTVLRSLEENDKRSPQERWALFGTSLGSVLTDEAGGFALDFTPAGQGGGGVREHVLLVVFAPDDVGSVDRPFPLPPEKRILYMSSLPKFEHGQQACLIRLLPAQLEKFGLAPAGSPPTSEPAHDPSSKTYADVLERAFVFKESLKTLVKPRLQAQVANVAATKIAAKKKFANLSAIPAENRNHPQLLTDPSKLYEMMQKTVAAGIAKHAAAPSSLQLSLSADEVKTLGLKTSERGMVSGQVKASTLSVFLSARNGGVDLVSKRPSNVDPAKLLADHAPSTTKAPPSTDAPPTSRHRRKS